LRRDVKVLAYLKFEVMILFCVLYFRITTAAIYVLSLVFMVVFTFTLQLDLWVDYVVIGLLG